MQFLSLDQYLMEHAPELQFEQQPGWLALLQKHCWANHTAGVYRHTTPGERVELPLVKHQNRCFGLKTQILEGLTGLYSSHYRPQAESAEALEDFLEQLLATEAWDVLRFSAVDKGGNLHCALGSLAKRNKLAISCRSDFEHWFLKIDKMGFDAYHAQLPGALRSTLKRRGAKLASRFQVRFELCRDLQQLPAALKAYKQIYSNSWKNAESHPDFIPELCDWAAQKGWLRLGVLYLDDQPAAAQIWMIVGARASIFKLAYDQGYRDLSVGSLLTARMMEHAINDEKVDEVEYGKGGEAYKRDWMSSSLKRVKLECYNPATLAGRLMCFRHSYLPALRDRLWHKVI